MERDSVKGEEVERKSQFKALYEAAIRGNANHLRELLQKHPLILDEAMSDCVAKDNHPLHIGALFGHVEFIREILNTKSELTREINSQGSSLLHVASEKGHGEVVKLLLDIDADICFLRDVDGRMPLHLAAMKGRVEVLKQLVRAQKIAAWMLTKQRQPILHVCAEHGQFEALKMLVDFVQEDGFVNLKDSDDNTILHVLSGMEEFEVIKFLIDKMTGLDVNSRNVHGSTAMDVLEESHHGKHTKKIKTLLRSAKAKLAREISQAPRSRPKKRGLKYLAPKIDKNQWNEIGEGLMVVAILIATVTFQAMTNPPGGSWQDDIGDSHRAGKSIMATKFPEEYAKFKTFNTIAFVASLILIVLLVSRYSLKERASVWALTLTTWIAMLSIFVTYFLVAFAADYDYWLYFVMYFFLLLLWLLLVAIMGPLSRFLKELPQRRCFQLMKLGIKRLFGWILEIIFKLCCFKVRNNTHSDFRNMRGEANL